MNCIVHGVAKSWTQLSDFHFLFPMPGRVQVQSLVGKLSFHVRLGQKKRKTIKLTKQLILVNRHMDLKKRKKTKNREPRNKPTHVRSSNL